MFVVDIKKKNGPTSTPTSLISASFYIFLWEPQKLPMHLQKKDLLFLQPLTWF